MLDKNFDQITPEDVTNLCRDGVYENQLLEFKRDLPAERNRPDPWLTVGDFTAYARDHLLREVIAFANAQGGTVIVGMDQIRDDPPRAAAICPLPRIHDLAMRMENAARACIDPVIEERDGKLWRFLRCRHSRGDARSTSTHHYPRALATMRDAGIALVGSDNHQ